MTEPAQRDAKTVDMARVGACTERVPRALWGETGTPARCTVMMPPAGGPHKGNHRAARTVQGTGKAVYRWKGVMAPRPEIVLPRPTAGHVQPRRGVVQCVSACPPGAKEHQHAANCPRRSL